MDTLMNIALDTPAPTASETLINVTPAAAVKIRELMAKEGDAEYGLRMSVLAGGCSGFQYQMGLEETPTEKDQVFTSNGIKVIVDNKSALYLAGVQVDYKNGLMESGFNITNPNAQATCGCGQSFR
jgi:iron-sulfur cluster assembly accessory protein